MLTSPERLRRSAGSVGNRGKFGQGSSTSQDRADSLSTVPMEDSRRSAVLQFSGPDLKESTIMHNTDLHKESPFDNPDRILDHCFKQFKLKEAYPHFFFKVKKSRFGPPRSRRRIFIAPPMGGRAPSSLRLQPHVPCDLKGKTSVLEMPPEAKDKISAEEDELQQLEAWIEKRKKLRDLLNNCVNLEEWLTAKQPGSELEASVLVKIKEDKEPKEVKMEATLDAVKSIEHLMPKRQQRRPIPLINIPYPESLKTLQSLLHKQKLKLVDLFNKADRTKSRKFKRADFIRIIHATKVPISKNDLEEVVIYLTSLTKGNDITSDDLAECQKIWMDSVRDQWKQTKETKLGTRGSSAAVSKASFIAQSKAQLQMNSLEVPPINTEPDRMHLTYNQMEIVGKRYKEMRRRLKRKVDPIDFAEQCRMVKTGDLAVDGHCMPSTMEGEMGELIDKHRLACHLVWIQCVRLCEKYRVPLTEKLLKKALLYPGDRILREGNHFRKIRQPGSYYSTSPHPQPPSEEEQSGRSSEVKKGKTKPKTGKEEVKEEKTVKCRWMSFSEFRKLMRSHSKRLLPPVDLWKNRTIYENLFETPESLTEKYVERELRKMFDSLNPLTDPNSFWPGHLLDKLRLYLPQMEHDEGHALFSRVSRTNPVYPGIYTPDRSWQVSDQGYVTYGDPDYRKHYYYV